MFKAWILIIIFLGCILALFMWLKIYSNELKISISVDTNCEDLKATFGSDELFKQYAKMELDTIENDVNTEIYQCYCSIEEEAVDAFLEDDNMCRDYYQSFYISTVTKNSITIAIIVINIALRFFNIWLIGKIGFNYTAQVVRSIMYTIFITQLFNTGLIIIFADANLEDHFLGMILPISAGEHKDFSSQWYLEIGPIIV